MPRMNSTATKGDKQQVAAILAAYRQSVNDVIKQRGISRSHIAEQLGLSNGRISQILNTDENVTVSTLQRIAAYLDLTISINVS